MERREEREKVRNGERRKESIRWTKLEGRKDEQRKGTEYREGISETDKAMKEGKSGNYSPSFVSN